MKIALVEVMPFLPRSQYTKPTRAAGTRLRADHVADVLQVDGDAAQVDGGGDHDADVGGHESAHHEHAHDGSGVGDGVELVAHRGDELHALVVGDVGLLAAEPVDHDVHGDPDEDAERVALSGHVSGQGTEDGGQQRAEDGVADGGERAHEAGLQGSDSLEALDALFLLDRQVDTGDDRVEEVRGVEERGAVGARSGLQLFGVVPRRSYGAAEG